jgi:hypothetical protein
MATGIRQFSSGNGNLKTSVNISISILCMIALFDFLPSATALVECRERPLPIKIQNFLGSALSKSRQLFNRAEPTVVAKATADQPSSSLYSSFLVPLLAGGAATAFGDLVVHPLDTIKTVQQA